MAKKGTTHQFKTGPIPDDHWENETRPNPAERLRKRYGQEFIDSFDAKTEAMRAERDAELAKRKR